MLFQTVFIYKDWSLAFYSKNIIIIISRINIGKLFMFANVSFNIVIGQKNITLCSMGTAV